jgi:hypothetical protein
MNEIERGINAAIDMGLGGKINHGVTLVFGHERIHLVGVGDVGFEKLVAFAMFLEHAVEIGEIARVGEHVNVGHVRRLVMLQNIPNKVAPDESTATGHENAHCSAY